MMHPARQAYVEEEASVDRSISLEDLPTDHDHAIPSAVAGVAPEKASALLSQFERKRLAASLAVPTDDGRVRARLRDLGEPITLFGEGPADRRDRLRDHMTTQAQLQQQAAGAQAGEDVAMADASEADPDSAMGDDDEQEEEFYTTGSQDLLHARQDIARFSLPRARQRLDFQKRESEIPLRTHVKFRKQLRDRLQAFELQGSQTAGDRNVSMTRIAPNGQMVAAGNWGGSIKLIDIPSMDIKGTLRGHNNRIGGIAWLPGATQSGVSESELNLASGGADGQVHLWSLTEDTPVGTLAGHAQRVCRVEFHPSGRYLATASEDTTWRLWDVQRKEELLLQEGHSRGVFAIGFNTDGSLLASGGMDSIGRIWDLRSGRTVMILDGHQDGHIKPIHGIDWGADGHRVLTGSADGFVKCWDVRKVQRTGGVGAHSSAVSDMRWFKGLDDPVLGTPPPPSAEGDGGSLQQAPKKSGTFFVSSGFDQKVNIFSADDWSLVQTLHGHTGPVASVDVSRDGRWIVSGGHDKTVKLWGRNDGEAA